MSIGALLGNVPVGFIRIKKEHVETDLEIFATSRDAHEQTRALSALIKLKKLHKAASTSSFDVGIDALIRAMTAGSDSGRLTAAATLSRIANLVKGKRERIVAALPDVLQVPLIALESAEDPDDRYYIAALLRCGREPWLPSYLARSAMFEEGSERVRTECLEGLLETSEDLSGALAQLSAAVRRLSFATERRGDSKARRVRRVIESLRAVFSTSKKDTGPAIGEAIRTLLVDCFLHDGLPSSPEILRDLSEVTLDFTHEVLRARFALATRADTYLVLEVVRGWYRDHTWTDFAEQSPAAKTLVEDLSASLEILLRAGLADDELYGRLVTASGGGDQARAIGRQLLSRLPGLREDLSYWLSGLQATKKSEFAQESQNLALEGALAELIINSGRLRELASRVNSDVLPEIGVLSPQAAAQVESLLGAIRSTVNTLDAVARVRSLNVRGTIGERAEYSPLQHELVGGSKPGGRFVRVVRPLVEVPIPGGGARIIRKALVEPMEEDR